MAVITLLTDFGLQDVYVGVMKGVMTRINPELQFVDLTHQIPPQDLMAARFNLLNAYPYFPTDTVHLVVVDPGVGSQRRGIAIQTETGCFVGPDNGMFSGVLAREQGVIAAVELNNPAYWRSPSPSATFHGRDIFAPVAAHLASGVLLLDLGEAIDPSSLIQFSIPACTPTDSGWVGTVQYIDHFGNIITTIPEEKLKDHFQPSTTPQPWTMELRQRHIRGCITYSDVHVGDLATLVGSHGWLEIAVNGGNAQAALQAAIGDRVELRVENQPMADNG